MEGECTVCGRETTLYPYPLYRVNSITGMHYAHQFLMLCYTCEHSLEEA